MKKFHLRKIIEKKVHQHQQNIASENKNLIKKKFFFRKFINKKFLKILINALTTKFEIMGILKIILRILVLWPPLLNNSFFKIFSKKKRKFFWMQYFSKKREPVNYEIHYNQLFHERNCSFSTFSPEFLLNFFSAFHI